MKKIMFNDKYGLTKAVIDGRKTMTRRIVPQSTIDKYALLEDNTIIDDARYDIGVERLQDISEYACLCSCLFRSDCKSVIFKEVTK